MLFWNSTSQKSLIPTFKNLYLLRKHFFFKILKSSYKPRFGDKLTCKNVLQQRSLIPEYYDRSFSYCKLWILKKFDRKHVYTEKGVIFCMTSGVATISRSTRIGVPGLPGSNLLRPWVCWGIFSHLIYNL